MVLELKKENFDAEVLQSQIPVVVDFYADWCGPCKMMAPVLAEVSGKYDGRVKFCKINTDMAQDLAVRYGVDTIPNIKLFKDGKPVASSVGVVPAAKLESMVDGNM